MKQREEKRYVRSKQMMGFGPFWAYLVRREVSGLRLWGTMLTATTPPSGSQTTDYQEFFNQVNTFLVRFLEMVEQAINGRRVALHL